MPSIDADQCSLSAVVRPYLSWTIEWSVMNVAAVQDSTSSDSVQPEVAILLREDFVVPAGSFGHPHRKLAVQTC